MTELEQLRADLATIQTAAKIAKRQGYPERSGNYDEVEIELKEKIADLEAQEQKVDPWAKAKNALFNWITVDAVLNHEEKRSIYLYVASLKAKVDELHAELRCERIDGGKVRDDRKAISAEQNRQELAKLTTILNAIPPACGLARELVERRIEGVKKELQSNGN